MTKAVSEAQCPVVVLKFGGTSVADVARIKHVAGLVASYREREPNTAIVVILSAMAGETNKLVALAKSCVKSPDPREMDVLLASGEQVTVALLAMRLKEIGLPAQSMLGPQVKIATDSRHTNAHIEEIDTRLLKRCLGAGIIPVIAGFQGVDDQGDITTLGRGGSDISAVAIATALKAKWCFIYTDVAGVFSVDPRVCREAKLLNQISYEEMLEMASLGAKVLHTRSVYFAMRYKVPLVVLSTFSGDFCPGRNGTVIVEESEGMEKPVVTGVTHRLDEARMTIEAMPSDIKTIARVFSVLGEKGVFIDMISQESTIPGKVHVSITVPDEVSASALETLRALVPEVGAQGVRVDRDIAKISIVGIGMRYHTGVAARMFEALAREAIDVLMINTSEVKLSVLVPRKYCEVAVRSLHDEFFGASKAEALQGVLQNSTEASTTQQ